MLSVVRSGPVSSEQCKLLSFFTKALGLDVGARRHHVRSLLAHGEEALIRWSSPLTAPPRGALAQRPSPVGSR